MTWNELVELVNSQLTEEQKEYDIAYIDTPTYPQLNEYGKHWVVVASDKVKEISIS